MKHIKIIHPASKAPDDTLLGKIIELKNLGFKVSWTEPKGSQLFPWLANELPDRVQELNDALLDTSIDLILCGRGGYGASDLLEHIPWDTLKNYKPKLLCGFSDISVLHSAFKTKLGWNGLHCPMPNTQYWTHCQDPSIVKVVDCFRSQKMSGRLSIQDSFFGPVDKIEGEVFGGCLSVLTHLIGTSYLPDDLTGKILFFEDIGESPQKIFRLFNQWIQSNRFRGVEGIVLGNFAQLESLGSLSKKALCHEIQRRTKLPIFSSEEFGHTQINYPILVGSQGFVDQAYFTWQQRSPHENKA